MYIEYSKMCIYIPLSRLYSFVFVLENNPPLTECIIIAYKLHIAAWLRNFKSTRKWLKYSQP